MTQSFDEWFEKEGSNNHIYECEGWIAERGFIAGAKSRQAEVDELKKRIDKIENHVAMNYDCERDDDQHSYWSGHNQAMRELNDILEGKEND